MDSQPSPAARLDALEVAMRAIETKLANEEGALGAAERSQLQEELRQLATQRAELLAAAAAVASGQGGEEEGDSTDEVWVV